jgi:protein-tyrosine phosphatase
VEVHSAGTQALVGSPVDPPVAELLRLAGADPDGFSARQLVAEQLRAADLVLVMSRDHRAAVVAAEPAAVRRTFLLRELAVLAEAVARAGWPADVPADATTRLRVLPQLAARHRPAVARTQGLEIEDPYRRTADVYERVLAGIEDAVARLTSALTG